MVTNSQKTSKRGKNIKTTKRILSLTSFSTHLIVSCGVIPIFDALDEIQKYSVAIEMKAIEQYVPVLLFIMLYKVAQGFASVDELLQCDHSNDSHSAVLSCGTVYYAVQGG